MSSALVGLDEAISALRRCPPLLVSAKMRMHTYVSYSAYSTSWSNFTYDSLSKFTHDCRGCSGAGVVGGGLLISCSAECCRAAYGPLDAVAPVRVLQPGRRCIQFWPPLGIRNRGFGDKTATVSHVQRRPQGCPMIHLLSMPQWARNRPELRHVSSKRQAPRLLIQKRRPDAA